MSTQPEDVVATYGTTATFTISASNVDSYQWQMSTNGTDWNDITDGGTEPSYTGSSTTTLVVANVIAELDGYIFRVVLANANDCETLSEIATLQVTNELLAVDDDFSDVTITEGQGGIAGDVTANDISNGMSVNDSTITISLTDNGGLTGATIDTNGVLSIPASAVEGTYTLGYTICEVADLNNCSSATVIVVVQPDLSLTDLKLMGVKLFPNPATTEVFINIADLRDATVRVFDVNGRRLLEQAISTQLHRIDVASFPAGVYLFDITSSRGKIIKKIIKQE